MGARRPARLAAAAVLVLGACHAPGPDVTARPAGPAATTAPAPAPGASPPSSAAPAGRTADGPAAGGDGVGDALYPDLGNPGFDVEHYDLALIPRLLKSPPRQPDYRENRPHTDFITNLPLNASTLRSALVTAFTANQPLVNLPDVQTNHLLTTRYSQPAWNLSR